MRDQHGVEMLAPPPVRHDLPRLGDVWAWTVIGFVVGGFGAILTLGLWESGVGASFVLGLGTVAGAASSGLPLRRATARLAQRREEAAKARRAAGALTPIAEAGERARIRGHVRVLRATRLSPELEAGLVSQRRPTAAVRQEWVADGQGNRHLQPRKTKGIEEHTECGRFAVQDEQGDVAVVDDDAFAFHCLSDRLWDYLRGRTVALEDGDRVEVIGPARRQPVPDDVRALARSGGYRGASEVLVFDGQPDDRVLIVCGID